MLRNLLGRVGQLYGKELERAVADADDAFEFGHGVAGGDIFEAHEVAAHLLADRVGEVAHTPVIRGEPTAGAFDDTREGAKQRFTRIGSQLRGKEQQGFKLSHAKILLVDYGLFPESPSWAR